MKYIPERYVIGRWKKLAYASPVHDVLILDVENYVGVSEVQQLTNKILSSMFGC